MIIIIRVNCQKTVRQHILLAFLVRSTMYIDEFINNWNTGANRVLFVTPSDSDRLSKKI